jgi:hypothetical protein
VLLWDRSFQLPTFGVIAWNMNARFVSLIKELFIRRLYQ